MTLSDSLSVLTVSIPIAFLLGLIWVLIVQFSNLDL